MYATRILRTASALPRAIAGLVPKEASEALQNNPRNLFETLSRLPNDGVGSRVFQTRWQSKGIEGCFYEVTRVKLKHEGTGGKAWGWLVWRGMFRWKALVTSQLWLLGLLTDFPPVRV